MVSPERRRFPRTQISRLACIHIEPDTGGIVLNVSNEGLCFHSAAPVDRNGAFRFALMEHNRRIDMSGDLIWTEATRKIGGVRFTTLSTEAREQIRSWSLSTADDMQAASTSSPKFARAVLGLNSINFRNADLDINRTPGNPRLRIRLSSFSRGVATGLLSAALIATVALFLGAHRRQFGESLINLGERLAARPRTTVAASTTLQVNQPVHISEVKPGSATTGDAPFTVANHRNTSPPEPEAANVVHTIRPAVMVKSKQEAIPLRVPQILQSRESTKQPANPNALHSLPISLVTAAALRVPADVLPQIPIKPPQLAVSAAVVPNFKRDDVFVPSMYFDLGKYKDEMRAQDIRDQVARLGFRSNVVQKAFLWRTSYQVLVGPYSDEQVATQVGRDLTSKGYKPRPFERGTRDFMFGSGVTLNGAALPVGDFEISWESFVNAAKVKFSQRDATVINAEGRWVRQQRRFRHNEFVYVKAPNGVRTLIEIHFSGMDRALVFGKAS